MTRRRTGGLGLGVVALAICLLPWLPGAGLPVASAADAVADPHPELDEKEAMIDCVTCHAEMTPEVFAEWYAGAHGLMNVKCFVCHGSLDDFRAAPGTAACISCHSEYLESAPARGGTMDCFQCHPGHLLDPHRTVPDEEGES